MKEENDMINDTRRPAQTKSVKFPLDAPWEELAAIGISDRTMCLGHVHAQLPSGWSSQPFGSDTVIVDGDGISRVYILADLSLIHI